MPQMGESVTEGTVLEWHVSEGQEVAEGDTVVEVSTDKVDAEVPAPAGGVITKLLVDVDETVEVGQVLARIDPNGAAASGNGAGVAEASPPTEQDGLVMGGGEGDQDLGEDGAPSEAPQPGQVTVGAPAGETVVIAMPEMGESVTEGVVLEWHVSEGQRVNEGDTVVEVSTDKVDAEVPAPAGGTITKLLAEPDATVQVGQALAEMTAGAAVARLAAGRRARVAHRDLGAEAAQAGDGDGRASPLARRVAAAKGLDIGTIQGTAPGGKVTKEDVLAAAEGNGAAATAPAAAVAGEEKALRGPGAMLARTMNESKEVPTATSFRTVPVDVLDAKRKAINEALKKRGMKVSFTHLIAWAIVRAAIEWPVMGRSYLEREGKPFVVETDQVNLGIAVDVERKGGRSLMVPCIKGAQDLEFAGFHSSYEELITRTRENTLTADDFKGTNISLTNPGGLGTVASVPRLPKGQGTIVATGSIAYPVEWSHAPAEKIKALGVSKVMTMTSTYDHRVIQGAESGSFLRRIDQLIQGEDNFYESVAAALQIPVGPVANAHPASASAPPLGTAPRPPAAAVAAEPDTELLQAVQAATSLLKAYRTHGHLAARVNPLGSDPKGDPALEPENVNLTPDLMAKIPASILRLGVEGETLLDALPRMREAYCGTIAYQIEHLSSHQQRVWLREMIETGWHRAPLEPEEKRALLSRLTEVFQFERFLQKAYLGQKMFSIEGLDVTVPMLDEIGTLARQNGAEEVVIGMAHRGRLAVLAHNLGRSVESIMAEFEGAKALDQVKAIAAIPHSGHRRRQVPPRRRGPVHDPRRRAGEDAALPEPLPPRVRRPGGHRRRPRRADRALRAEPAPQPARRGAGAAARRRGVPRPGGRRRDPQPAVARRLLDRRHDPPDHRQPGRVHDGPQRGALDPVRRRHGEGLQLPDHPRQRRRRRGLRLGGPAGDGLPRAVGPGRGHRPDRLSPLRPQRDRRARLHAAADGGGDQGAQAGLRALRRELVKEGVVSPDEVGRGRRRAPGRAPGDPEGAAGQDGGGRVRGPELHRARHRRARPDQEPRGGDRRLREAAAVAQRGAAPGARQLHHPPQAAKAAARPGSRSSTRARSSSATPRRSHSPRCSPRALTSGSRDRTPSGDVLEPPPRAARREDRPQVRPDPAPVRVRWRRSSSTTARCRRPAASASSTATRRPRPRA